MLRRPLVAASLAGALLLGAATSAGATGGAVANRLAGSDRYVTARAIGTATFTSSTVAILAGGESFADALPAAYLSGAEAAPLFLTPPGGLPTGLVNTLNDLKVDGVQIVGGTTAVSENVVTQLEAAGFAVERLAGANRYETARKVAELLPVQAVGKFGAGAAAIVVTGESFPDALAAGPMSASQGLPILLTNSAGLHDQAKAALQSLAIKQVLIIGGTGAVSQSSEDQIKALGIAVRRIAGPSRQATAVAVAKVEVGELNYPLNRVLLARGDSFADALAGGTRGGKVFAPILLTGGAALGTDARTYIKANTATIATIDVLGGSAAVSDAVANDAVAAA
ncbi:MAG: putative internalin, partial [Actinomycetia bacterium]|nr:putative internalin [Actinomycetes bacterium]